jgi:phage FluMu protein Com
VPIDATTLRATRLARPFVQRHPGEEPVRCWKCARILATVIGVSGHLNLRCPDCKCGTSWSSDEDVSEAVNATNARSGYRPIRALDRHFCCICGHSIFFASLHFVGTVHTRCQSCRMQNSVKGTGHLKSILSEMSPEEFVAMMEERWLDLYRRLSRRRAEVAIGLRFDVFKRDGFRCRYCGRSVDDGAILHADHVIPQSKGGPTTKENLVTACFECNIGKSNKDLGDIRPAI